MANILTGPINMEQAANFIESITKAYYTAHDEGKYVRTERYFWEPSDIVYPLEYLPSENDSFGLVPLYKNFRNDALLAKLKNVSSEFVVTIKSYDTCRGSIDPELRTRIFNLSKLEDLTSGQIFAPAVSKFVIASTSYPEYSYSSKNNGNGGTMSPSKFFEDFIDFRDTMIRQAQDRINGTVSKAAYNLMNDLHS